MAVLQGGSARSFGGSARSFQKGSRRDLNALAAEVRVVASLLCCRSARSRPPHVLKVLTRAALRGVILGSSGAEGGT